VEPLQSGHHHQPDVSRIQEGKKERQNRNGRKEKESSIETDQRERERNVWLRSLFLQSFYLDTEELEGHLRRILAVEGGVGE
jgi:hypothetical protein